MDETQFFELLLTAMPFTLDAVAGQSPRVGAAAAANHSKAARKESG
jgi:hypothetical protein